MNAGAKLLRGKPLASFVSSTRGGGMLVACVLVMLTLTGVGGSAVDYAWREAQFEEFEARQRAAVAALGVRLGEQAQDPDTARALVDILEAMQPGFTGAAATIVQRADGAVEVTIGGEYAVEDLFGGSSAPETVEYVLLLRLETDRYEVALALDITTSMRDQISRGGGATGQRIVKMAALREAMWTASDVLGEVARDAPGAMLVSVVPFAGAVNVADTDAAGRTAAKERYVRMLAGAAKAGRALPMADVLAEARAAAGRGEGQWVDTFHSYGVGADMGPLRSQALPAAVLDDRDWDMRRTARTIDIADQRPEQPDWIVDDRDFWNGCLMARWGAYWAAAARPAGWDPTDRGNWPAETDVPGWSPAAPTLRAPLHLADAPPVAGEPHTLFTAYSWPDAAISRGAPAPQLPGNIAYGNSADHYMQVVMAKMLDDSSGGLDLRGVLGQSFTLDGRGRVGMNYWRDPRGGGHVNCPGTPILPLTGDKGALDGAIDDVAVIDLAPESFRWLPQPGQIQVGSSIVSTTFLVRGVVWALRTLSPLWRDVWDLPAAAGTRRPGVPCRPGEQGACDDRLNKAIVLVTDGGDWIGSIRSSRTSRAWSGANQDTNPPWLVNIQWGDLVCYDEGAGFLTEYREAWTQSTPNEFNQYFAAQGVALDANGRFANPEQMRSAFQVWGIDPTGLDVLKRFTPWELFRGPSGWAEDIAFDALMEPANGFGLGGRPVQTTGHCRPTSPFSAYGGVDEHVLVGSRAGPPREHHAPIPDVAPFHMRGIAPTDPNTGKWRHYGAPRDIRAFTTGIGRASFWGRLNDLFMDACRIAGQRRVRINVVYIGDQSAVPPILERCADVAGGDPGETDVLVTPDAAELEEAFRSLFVVRHSLHFLT